MKRALAISSNDRRAMAALVRHLKASLPEPAESYGRGSAVSPRAATHEAGGQKR